MKNRLLIIMCFLATFYGCLNDPTDRSVARLENDKLVLTLNRKWNAGERADIARKYNIDSLLMESLFTGITSLPDTVGWKIEKRGKKYIEISSLPAKAEFELQAADDFMLLDMEWQKVEPAEDKPVEKTGINVLADYEALSFSDSVVTFKLKGFKNAGEVYLSGSFNSWSTMRIPLNKVTGEGNGNTWWQVSIPLSPGKYTYKYIVDGSWKVDQGNMLKEREEGRGVVSVLYVPVKIFELAGYNDARKVVLTGNFINWKRHGIEMKRSGDKWVLPLFLRNGTWSYKFIVDGTWLADPSNPDTREDAFGNMNSFISIGDKYYFSLKGFTDAETVVLSGSFNNWSSNELVMHRKEGIWKIEIALDPGNWEYKYIVDGSWITDPDNPYTTGSGDYLNSLAVLRPSYIFILEGYPGAESVIVTGNFNNWDEGSYRMVKEGNTWKLPLHLKPGKCLYKFIVDGNWILDPGNENWEENEYGTGNSVLWFEKP